MSLTYTYSKKDLSFDIQWNSNVNSQFDDILTIKWSTMQKQDGFFKYKLKINKYKILPGKFQYLAQLNLDRASLRRKPVEMQSMKQKFDANSFNFTKMDEKEILFRIVNKDVNDAENYLAINVSPLEFGHCLLLPALNSCLPQVVTDRSLLAAIELFLLSKSPAMRMGFNGLCAYASVNHLHFHIYYLQHKMLLETIEVEHLAGPCYMLCAFPSQGYVFQLASEQDIHEFVRNVYKLINFLQEKEKPHNIFVTRGSSFQDKSPGSIRNHVRLYVWTRKPVYGTKDLSAFHPALCEMFGHIIVKTTDDYERLTEEFVSGVMSDQTVEQFESVKDDIKLMFTEV